MFWSAKNSVAIISCQSLLLGTNIPNDKAWNRKLFCTCINRYLSLSNQSQWTWYYFIQSGYLADYRPIMWTKSILLVISFMFGLVVSYSGPGCFGLAVGCTGWLACFRSAAAIIHQKGWLALENSCTLFGKAYFRLPYSRKVWQGKVWWIWRIIRDSPNYNHLDLYLQLITFWLIYSFAKLFSPNVWKK